MKLSRTTAIMTAAAALGLAVTGTASAAATARAGIAPALSSCAIAPSLKQFHAYGGVPVRDQSYPLDIGDNSFNAEWSSAWNLFVNYTRKDGSTISGTFEYLVLDWSDYNGVARSNCYWGSGAVPFTESAPDVKTASFTGANQPPTPSDNGQYGTEVWAVMDVTSENYVYAIEFTGQ